MGGQSQQGPPRASLWGTLFTVFALLLCAISANAHSTAPGALKRLHTPARSSLRILPRSFMSNGMVKRNNFEPNPESLRYDDTVLLRVSLPSLLGSDVHLMVSRNADFFHPDATITYRNDDGSTHVERLNPEDYKLYQGDVIRRSWVERAWEYERVGFTGRRDKAVIGRASVMIHEVRGDDVKWEGTFTVDGETFNVMTRENYNAVKTADDVEVGEMEGGMVVFTNRDMAVDKRTTRETCGLERLAFNTDSNHPVLRRRDTTLPRLRPRNDMGGETGDNNYADNIGDASGCGNQVRVLYMGVMLDCTYVASFPSVKEARENILSKFSTVSKVYQSTFKISIGIVDLQVMNGTCPSVASNINDQDWNVDCESKTSMDSRLGSFSRWRGNQANADAGLWHLMTKCKDGSEVGIAWLGQICTTDVTHQTDNWVSGTGVSSMGTAEWNVIAHEVGHGFGAIHDCNAQSCGSKATCCPLTKSTCDAGGQFIMNPTTGDKEVEFSKCSLGNVCTWLKSSQHSCLVPSDQVNKKLIGLNQCGNGIIEEGEECDPGGNNGTSACCENCKLRPTAKCDISNGLCCNPDTCQILAQGITCRPSIDKTCDIEEVCPGGTAQCPKDETTKDGTSCGDGLTCASGHCTSLDQQCKIAGASMGLSKACGAKNDKSCIITCKAPGGGDACTILQAELMDGSPCGYGGRCYNHTCKAGSWTEQLDAMYTENLQIAIPVTVAVGLIILAIIYQLIRCCFCRGPPRPKKSHGRPRAATNSRGGRAVAGVVAPNTYQPISEPLLDNGSSIDTRQLSHARGGSISSDEVGTAAGARPGDMPMQQMYQDPYSHGAGAGANYGANPGYGQSHDYNASPDYGQAQPGYGQGGGGHYNQQQPSHWVDERDFNGPSYQRY